MKSKEAVRKICQKLKKRYPNVKTQLDYRNPFELLIATILAAQCTDRQVNLVTPRLFEAFPTPRALADAQLAEIETIIHSTGFFHNKAKNIKRCADLLDRRFDGTVPQSLEALLELPGVGRKTANVVRCVAFGQPAIVVDTHVKRISQRLGLTENADPTRIEFDLMACIPEAEWNDFGLLLIYFGRDICLARKPKCPECFLSALCDFPDKTSQGRGAVKSFSGEGVAPRP